MKNQFDELAKDLAQSVTRRAALKKFGLGAAVAFLAAFGLTPRARAGNLGEFEPCNSTGQCQKGLTCMAIWISPGPMPKKIQKYCLRVG
jgi:hypothetical protein